MYSLYGTSFYDLLRLPVWRALRYYQNVFRTPLLIIFAARVPVITRPGGELRSCVRIHMCGKI